MTFLSLALLLALTGGLVGTLWQLSRAERNAAENLRQVARLHALNGVNFMQEGDLFKSLLWFAEALSLNTDPPERTVVDRLRIASTVAMAPQLAAVITHDGEPVADAAFHPTKEQLATVGRDRRLRIWAVATGELICMTKPIDEPPSHVQFAPDGERVLVIGAEFNCLRVFSCSTGEPLSGPISHLASGANNDLLLARFDATSQRLLTQSAPNTLQVWSVNDASPLGSPLVCAAPVAWMNFREDGKQVLTITQDGRASAWDWQSGAPHSFAPVEEEGARPVRRSSQSEGGRADEGSAAAWQSRETKISSPDGTRHASISSDHRVRVFSTDTGEPLTPPLDHNAAARPVEFSASGRFLFTMHPAHAVYVWDLQPTREPPVLLRPGSPHTLVESGQNGSVFVTRDPNSPIRVRALGDAAEVSLHPSSLKESPVQAWFDETGQFIVLEYPKQRAQIWDAATGLPVTPVFQSRYASDEAEYRTVRLPTLLASGPQTTDHGPSAFAPGASADKQTTDDRFLTSDFRPLTSDVRLPSSVVRLPSSVLRSLAELLSGSRLDGTGGWKPLELGGIMERWDELNTEERSPRID